MTQELQKKVDSEIQLVRSLCKSLSGTPYYKKLGEMGIFSIVTTARSIGADPWRALNGGMYYVEGKVEMMSEMMNEMIRSKKHSISQDPASNDKVCILHGRRADNGDMMTVSYSIEEAQKANMTGKMNWKRYANDMLFARALSRLARRLFPDVIRGCYVEGEITGPMETIEVVEEESISDLEFQELDKALEGNENLRENYLKRLKSKYGIEDLQHMPKTMYEIALSHALTHKKNHEEMLGEHEQIA